MSIVEKFKKKDTPFVRFLFQRIERWWRSLRQGCVQNWISVFASLENDGLLETSNIVHM